MSERLSNTLQLTRQPHEDLQVAHLQDRLHGPAASRCPGRGRPGRAGGSDYDGFYTSIPNRQDLSTGARAVPARADRRPRVPGGVDFVGGANQVQASPFGEIGSQQTYFGAYVQDSWRVNLEADRQLRPALGLLQPRWRTTTGEQANFVPGPAGQAQYIIPPSGSGHPALAVVPDRCSPGTASTSSTRTSSAAASARRRRTTSRRALDFAYSPTRSWCVRGGYGLFYGAFENRGGNPSLGYNYPFQFTLVYNRVNDVTPAPLSRRLDRHDRARHASIPLDPVNVNATASTCAASASTTRRRTCRPST